MNTKTKLKAQYMAAAIGIVLVAAFGLFSYEARNEIYYLCGNFKPGTTYSSVIRQLDTTTLSGYRTEASAPGKEPGGKVVQSSLLHLHLLRCSIDFDSEKLVISASYG